MAKKASRKETGKNRRKGQDTTQTLTYPIPVRAERAITDKLGRTLKLAREIANHYLQIFYQKEWFEWIEEITKSSNNKAYKDIENLAPERNKQLPSRINRGILEIVGRTLRSIQERKTLYQELVSLDNDPGKWNYQRLIDKKGIYAKAEYVHNLAEQTQNHVERFSPWLFRLGDFGKSLIEKIRNGEDTISQYLQEQLPAKLQTELFEYREGEEPGAALLENSIRALNAISKRPLYDERLFADVELTKKTKKLAQQTAPENLQKLNRLLLEEAYPEDIVRRRAREDKLPDYHELQSCPQIKTEMISYAPDDGQAICIKQKGNSIEVEFKVMVEAENNENITWEWVSVRIPLPEFLQNKEIQAPDLRFVCIHGKYMPVLDYKIEVECVPYTKTDNFITVDWGIHKLVTVCVFDRQGKQISTPIFLKFSPILNKLLRIRHEINFLKAKRARYSRKSTQWKKYNKIIAQKWRKYRAINKAIAHLAANVIVYIAKLYNCSDVYVEWLKGLKSKKKSRTLNWIVNSTVRQKIYDLLAYKAKICGLKFNRPLNPGYTSQYCPRCGARGYHALAPNRPDEIADKGAWFFCSSCSFNADRDYVACCNLARKALYGNSLKDSKAIAYKASAISVLLSRQSSVSFGKPLLHNLKGWLKTPKKKDKAKSSLNQKKRTNNNTRFNYRKHHTVFLSHYHFFTQSLKL